MMKYLNQIKLNGNINNLSRYFIKLILVRKFIKDIRFQLYGFNSIIFA